MTSGNALMPTARFVAGEATAELPAAVARIGARDPLDLLVDREREMIERSVDALEVAASLEAAGVTDRVARVRFGLADVFELAEEVRRRVVPVAGARPAPAPGERTAWRDIGHSAIYLMPAAIFPAAVSVLEGGSAFLVAVVLTGAVGWVFSGVVAWLAYLFLGDDDPRSANALLWWSALSAIPLGAAVAGLAAAMTGAKLAVMLLGAAAMTYQVAVTVLVIRRREPLVIASIAPALVAGTAYLVAGPPLLPLAIATGVASIGCAFGLALRETADRSAVSWRLVASVRPHRRTLIMVLAYTALSAAFFLYPQVPHLINNFNVVITVLPLIAAMGVVEWRAHRFSEQARALLARVTHPRQFAARIWLVVLNGLCICFAVVGVLAVAVLGVLAALGRYSHDTAAMAAAIVLMGGAYFLGFLLANLGRYGWLCISLVLGLATYSLARIALPGVIGDADAFRLAAATLLLLHLAGLLRVAGDARRHR
jgi:hypothetical protein